MITDTILLFDYTNVESARFVMLAVRPRLEGGQDTQENGQA